NAAFALIATAAASFLTYAAYLKHRIKNLDLAIATEEVKRDASRTSDMSADEAVAPLQEVPAEKLRAAAEAARVIEAAATIQKAMASGSDIVAEANRMAEASTRLQEAMRGFPRAGMENSFWTPPLIALPNIRFGSNIYETATARSVLDPLLLAEVTRALLGTRSTAANIVHGGAFRWHPSESDLGQHAMDLALKDDPVLEAIGGQLRFVYKGDAPSTATPSRKPRRTQQRAEKR
ncbi:MAG: hypothetical protein ACREEG_15405, partial [Phenylobacterium sp.]